MEGNHEHVDPERRRGFAAMDPDKQKEIARKGGKAAHEQHRAHEFRPEEARAAGRKGGERVSANRDHMAAIGRKGGRRVSANREYMAQIGRRGGQSVSENREHMAEIGRRGGTSPRTAPGAEPAPGESETSTPANDD